MIRSIFVALCLLLPVLSAQTEPQQTPFEKLLPEQPLVEIHLENPAKLWKDLVKSRVGRVLASGSLAELRKAWKGSFELRLLHAQIGTRLGLTKTAGLTLFRDLQTVGGSVRLGWFPTPGFGGWVLEVDAEPQVLARIQKHLTAGFGESPVEGKTHLIGQESRVFKQKSGPWFHAAPVLLGERLYFAAWQHPDGGRMLAGTPGPWMSVVGLTKERTLIQRNKMPLIVVVDLRRAMAELEGRIENAQGAEFLRDETLQLAQLLGLPDTRAVGLALDIKRGRIVQEVRAEVKDGGRFSGFLGAWIPREGRAVDLMAFQAEGPRTSAFISVDMAKAYAEFTRIFKEGSREFGGEEMDLEEICEGMFGFSMKTDLIAPLDGRILFMEGVHENPDKKKRSGFCLGLGTKDPTKTGDVIEKLFAAGGMTKNEDGDYKGITIHDYDFSFLWAKKKLRYALTKGFFLFAFDEAGYDYLRQTIDREKAAEESRFRPQGDLKSQLMLVPQESATIVWEDTLIAATSLLEQWASVLKEASNDPEDPSQDDSRRMLALLQETLVPLLRKEGLATTLSALGRDRHGFWIRWVW